MNGDSERATRRRFVASCGGGAIAALCGCVGSSNEPAYRDGEVGQTNGSQRTAEQMIAAEALATTAANRDAHPLDSLALERHEFVVEDGYKGPTVQGVVSNTGDAAVKVAEVRVRVYDADGAHLGRYLATTGDLGGGERWTFEAVLLSSVSDIADYDIAVIGIPE